MFFFFVFGVPAGASFLGNHRLKLRFPDAVGGPKTSHGLRKTTTKFRKTPRQSPILDRFCCAEPDVLGSSATFPERSPKIGAKKCQNTEGIQLFGPIWCILPRCFFVSAHFFRGRHEKTPRQSSILDRFWVLPFHRKHAGFPAKRIVGLQRHSICAAIRFFTMKNGVFIDTESPQ